MVNFNGIGLIFSFVNGQIFNHLVTLKCEQKTKKYLSNDSEIFLTFLATGGPLKLLNKLEQNEVAIRKKVFVFIKSVSIYLNASGKSYECSTIVNYDFR